MLEKEHLPLAVDQRAKHLRDEARGLRGQRITGKYSPVRYHSFSLLDILQHTHHCQEAQVSHI